MFRTISRSFKIPNCLFPYLKSHATVNLRYYTNKKPTNEETIVIHLKYPKSFATLINNYKNGFNSWKETNTWDGRHTLPDFYKTIENYVSNIGTFAGFVSGCYFYYDQRKKEHSGANLAIMASFGVLGGLLSALIFVPISINWPVTVPLLLLIGTLSQIEIST